LAYSCDLRGDEETAINYYKQLVKRALPPVNALLNLAVLYEDRNEFEKAENELAAACKRVKRRYKILRLVRCGQQRPWVFRVCLDARIV